MLFNSAEFFILLTITFLLYYLPILRHFQYLMLIGASFIFYSWNNPVLGLLLLASVLVNSYGSFILSKPNQKNKRLINGISISLNLGLLICFKYLGLLSNIFLVLRFGRL